ncbi:uncharacterized protein CEXT_226861 [Caerostris extrusa]|uniref:Uncharacterized protein n=1 Tax=Caerostris extrusa TaxID=172846 RepID=A0AAV4NJR9_CAEEX|nr:uncharacterized protein CEXT_226861 [Caerostris extrusa]
MTLYFRAYQSPRLARVIYKLLTERNHDQKKKLGHSTDMIQSCIFNGIPKSWRRGVRTVSRHGIFLKKIIEHSYDPDYGNCYTIPPRNSKGQILEAREADFWQEANDLSLLVDLETDELMEKKRHPGIIVTVHDINTLPDIHTDGHMIGAGISYTLSVQKTSVHLLPLPYKTNCTNYLKLPWHKDINRRLTSRLCTVGCSQYYQFQKCKYVTQNLSLFYNELPYDPKKITEEDLRCAEAEELRTQDYCRSICGLPCKDTVFVVTSSSTPLSIKETTMELFSYLGGYSGVVGFSLLTVYELIEILFNIAKFAFAEAPGWYSTEKVLRELPIPRSMAKA